VVRGAPGYEEGLGFAAGAEARRLAPRIRPSEVQASGSRVSRFTALGILPRTTSSMVVPSRISRRLARTAIQTSWMRAAGPG
jgi:hypothetical protein